MKFFSFGSSTDGGRITLSKSTGRECNIELSKTANKDEGHWYFHIIHKEYHSQGEVPFKWYFHKVLVNVETRQGVRGAGDQIRNQDKPSKTIQVFCHQ